MYVIQGYTVAEFGTFLSFDEERETQQEAELYADSAISEGLADFTIIEEYEEA